jgi:hypothetical protein
MFRRYESSEANDLTIRDDEVDAEKHSITDCEGSACERKRAYP